MSNESPPVIYCSSCRGPLYPNANTCNHCGAHVPMTPYQSVFAQDNQAPPQYQQRPPAPPQQQYPSAPQQQVTNYLQQPYHQPYQQQYPQQYPQQYMGQPVVQQTYGQPATVVNIVNQTPIPTYFCPRCQCPTIPRYQQRISTGGWVVFALLLVFFFPLFWIGLLIKETFVSCGRCGFRMS